MLIELLAPERVDQHSVDDVIVNLLLLLEPRVDEKDVALRLTVQYPWIV